MCIDCHARVGNIEQFLLRYNRTTTCFLHFAF